MVRDHGFHPLRVGRVIRETADTNSFVLDVPDDLRQAFGYDAGQFVTFRVSPDGEPLFRCYSMSSAPAVDAELKVTVKRVRGGVVSNWMIDTLGPGDVVDVSRPAGVFCLGAGPPSSRGDVIAFGAGSGITPVLSIVKTALAATSRRVRLLYANRDRDTVIFRAELDALLAEYVGRLEVVHHLDVEHGFVDAETVHRFVDGDTGGEFFICGPGPFMAVVEDTLVARGVDAERIRIERFLHVDGAAADGAAADAAGGVDADRAAADGGADSARAVAARDADRAAAVCSALDGVGAVAADGSAVDGAAVHAAPAPADARITIEYERRRETADHRPGTTILQMARQMGLSPPYSCESGSCATCMAKVVEGAAAMRVNDALTPDEVDEGWVLTCQAVPVTPSVRVVYGYEEN